MKFILMLFSFILIISSVLYSGGILHQNLEDILTAHTLVFLGKVVNTGWQEDLRSIRWNYNLEIEEVIQGDLDTSISKAFYHQYLTYMYDDSGKVIGSQWLVIPGSGLEVNLEDDHTYIFFVKDSSHVYLDSILEFMRAEPLEKLFEVQKLLREINYQEE
ncbi:MAG: hypothetical protein APR63_09780 [Desulfuromonas sp. SDB]|nr:MAG: hypothetical protein APR63_09780 [Desulfuromonas sp. SDB]